MSDIKIIKTSRLDWEEDMFRGSYTMKRVLDIMNINKDKLMVENEEKIEKALSTSFDTMTGENSNIMGLVEDMEMKMVRKLIHKAYSSNMMMSFVKMEKANNFLLLSVMLETANKKTMDILDEMEFMSKMKEMAIEVENNKKMRENDGVLVSNSDTTMHKESDTRLKVNPMIFVLVSTSRSLESEKDYKNNFSLGYSKHKKSLCFVNLYFSLMCKFPINRSACSMSDLTTMEEMEMMSLHWNRTVYYYVYLDNMDSTKNHISHNQFKDSKEIKLANLSMPWFRSIRFYSDSADSKMAKDLVNVDLNKAEAEADSDMLHDIKSMEKSDNNMNDMINIWIPNMLSSICDLYDTDFKYNDNMELYDKEVFTSLKAKMLENLSWMFKSETKSKMSRITVGNLLSYSISYLKFLTVLLFEIDIKAFCNKVSNKKLNIMLETLASSKLRFYKNIYTSNRLGDEVKEDLWIRYLKAFPSVLMYDKELMLRSYYHFKMKSLYYVMFEGKSKEKNNISSNKVVNRYMKERFTENECELMTWYIKSRNNLFSETSNDYLNFRSEELSNRASSKISWDNMGNTNKMSDAMLEMINYMDMDQK